VEEKPGGSGGPQPGSPGTDGGRGSAVPAARVRLGASGVPTVLQSHLFGEGKHPAGMFAR